MTSSLDRDALDRATITALARETGFTADAVASMMRSVAAGRGRMAQFDHPEFGGPGQWMQGGMLMISDFSNRDLQQRVARLCEAIARHLEAERPPTTEPYQSQSQSAGGFTHVQDSRGGRLWWPASLGNPDTSGAQNDMRYAWFSDSRRLAIDEGGTVTIYDTGDHRISGVSQQQGGHRTVAFTSQHGEVDLSSLPTVGGGGESAREPGTRVARDVQGAAGEASTDPFHALEKLAALHARGILADDEFARKKAELLARI